MKLSEIIICYRRENHLSQREFAKRCGLSNSYISFIEKEVNPKTGLPMKPTMEQYKKFMDAMGMTAQRFFELLGDDAPTVIYFPEDKLSDEEIYLLTAYRAADPRAREDALRTLLDHPLKKEESAAI